MPTVINNLDFGGLWTWMLLYIRVTGLMYSFPGIGTEQVPETFRQMPALVLAACIAMAAPHATVPSNIAEGGLMAITEFILGYFLGVLPGLVMGGLTVAGQVISGAIGLSQANMIDSSLGESISVISRIKAQIATLIFLALDGHHAILRAAATTSGDLGIGMFRPDMRMAAIFLDRFIATFNVSLSIAAPVLVTALVTQFVLGLITKFVPQINIFIISMPLALLTGLFIFGSTLVGLSRHVERELRDIDTIIMRELVLGSHIPPNNGPPP